MITYDNVYKNYNLYTAALSDFSLTINKGELLVIIGPSGCGKTTAIKMINRMIEPTKGRIVIDDIDVKEMNPIELRRKIGYVIQQVGLFPNMTVFENIEIVPHILSWPKETRRQRSKDLLHMINMEPEIFGTRYPYELSGGQQQRVGVLRALAADPDIILMDEPFGAVDPITKTKLQQELKYLNNTFHKTIVLVTHDIDEAFNLADRVVLMNEGKILQTGTPNGLVDKPAHPFVTAFISKSLLYIRKEERDKWKLPATSTSI